MQPKSVNLQLKVPQRKKSQNPAGDTDLAGVLAEVSRAAVEACRGWTVRHDTWPSVAVIC